MHTQPYQTSSPSTIATRVRLCRQGKIHGTSRNTKRKETAPLWTGTQDISIRKPTTFQRLHSRARSVHTHRYSITSHTVAYQHTSIPASAAHFNPHASTYPIAYFPASHRIQPLPQDLTQKSHGAVPVELVPDFHSRGGMANGMGRGMVCLLQAVAAVTAVKASVNFEEIDIPI
ncbi:hypothetical protein DL98DRAFT_511881 [Cadophora sp. DSE1049]|nr:hypothetical protein DL98DRAFT_511881 [Cadophora sp. DSE1049]